MDFSHLRNYLFLGSLVIITTLFFYLLKPFAYPIFWAAVLAGLFYPMFKWLDRWLKHPNLSATITLVAVMIVIILPLTILATILIKEAPAVYSALNNSSGQLTQTLKDITYNLKNSRLSADLNIDDALWAQKFADAGRFIVNYLVTTLTNLTQNSLVFLGEFILMLYALFFFVRDGEKFLKKMMYLCPLGDRYEVMLYNKFTDTASAAIKGSLMVGAVQGSIGGIVFWIAGIPGALIWAIVMMFSSLIPGVGVGLIWLPVAIVMIILGHVPQGVFILIAGFAIISTIDNLIRPLLVGKNLKMPPLLVLFATLGGIVLFRFTGLILGPIIMALFLAFWEMYEDFYRADLKKN